MQKTDQRSVPRSEVNVTGTMQLLGTSAAGNGHPEPVTVLDVSERGMKLRSKVAMSAGQAVTVEMDDAMFLGEVCYCAPETRGEEKSFYVGVVTRECLTGLESLRHLIGALRPETADELEPSR
jgi:hypothetical protein